MRRLSLIATVFICIMIMPRVGDTASKNPSKTAAYTGETIQLIVPQGDWLMNICRKYLDSPNRWPEVARINRLKNPNIVHSGDKLTIPVEVLKGTPLDGKVTFVKGDAKVKRDGRDDWMPIRAGDRISQKSALRTGHESALEVTFEDGSSFLLRSETELGVLRAEKKSAAYLIRDLFVSTGRVMTRVQKATGEAPRFQIRTPSAIASVRGTEFRVAVDQEQRLLTEVLDGKVAAEAMQKTVEVNQGQGTVVKKGEAPLEPRNLLPPPMPVDIKQIYNSPPIFTLTEIAGAKSYRITLAKDQQAKDLFLERIVKAGDHVELRDMPDGTYYLLTQSIDDIGLEGPASDPFALRIRVNPIPPTPQSLREGAVIRDGRAEFHWSAISDAAKYHIQIAADKEFLLLAEERTDLTGVTYSTGSLAYKTYYFRVRSLARDGYQGEWSDPLSFTLIPPPPSAPVLSLENPAAEKDTIDLRSNDLGEGIGYHFQVSRDSAFSSVFVDQTKDKPEIIINKPKEPGAYYVRVSAVERNGHEGAFSDPQSFAIEKGICPYPFLGFFLLLSVIVALAL